MHLRYCFLILAISLLRPLAVQAQGKIEINVGVSTPGVDELIDTKFFDMGFESFDYYRDEPLNNLDESYKSTIYPCYSLELAYDIAESGFFKKLELLATVSYHAAEIEDIDIVNNSSNRETARKCNILIGIRYDIMEKEKFNMYTQFLAGGDILDSSKYWDYIYSNYEGEPHPTIQITILGFNWKLGGKESKYGFMTELGWGTDYGLSVLPIFPGIRAGLSYKF